MVKNWLTRLGLQSDDRVMAWDCDIMLARAEARVEDEWRKMRDACYTYGLGDEEEHGLLPSVPQRWVEDFVWSRVRQ